MTWKVGGLLKNRVLMLLLHSATGDAIQYLFQMASSWGPHVAKCSPATWSACLTWCQHALTLQLPTNAPNPSRQTITNTFLKHVPEVKKETLVDFLIRSFVYVDLYFAYLEINQLICLDGINGDELTIYHLNLAAKPDQPMMSMHISSSPSILHFTQVWPTPFGRDFSKEKAYIQKLDASPSAFLKLTIVSPEGCIWMMVAGGGASIVYAITAHSFAYELPNYGEYSSTRTEDQTYEYAKMIIDIITHGSFVLMARSSSLTGIICLLKEYKAPLIAKDLHLSWWSKLPGGSQGNASSGSIEEQTCSLKMD
ncbi:uncharacterized protein LAESUDRAFT_718467 [Laetiporus sulphureus 93-53]|uniref:ATP-citrate synthase citrate-binding domain-containing protein n=1 Tax=Laetiporus sulphureus 93-53 TaxID=1314785 RepID=A0A165AXL6_9APHY|nr:uncharacterized protein LAESUDRAFT_718467 [Laetiporus sulphureus 93-53]KZS99851.1 hypothetical protein LAESUDRAFT_718467 [Laetiporus sulphureus 93-53]